MARRGSFGRSPRPAASLTATLVSIAREMQQQNDQNIVDAWQKGGLYQGKPVTDPMILAYWKARMGQVDKKDPLHDTYQSAYMEYDYSIHESIMRTAYAQGKVNDHTAAAFYLNWSKKVPKNSEFWRVLQRDAADFTRQSRANSAAKIAQAKELQFRNDLSAIDKSKVAPGQYVLDVFKNLAQRGQRPGGGNALIDPMNGELYQFDAHDVQDMIGMIDRLTTGGANGRDPSAADRGTGSAGGVLYHEDNGTPVTASSVLAKLQTMGFKGNLTLDSLYTLISTQKQGLKQQADLATKTGHFTEATKYNNQLAIVSEVGREVKAWPVEQTYLDARNAKLAVFADPHSSAQDILDADAKYKGQLQKFMNDPAIAADDVFLNKLNAEFKGTEGASTAAEDFTGLNQGAQATDIATSNLLVKRAQDGIAAVASGQAVWTTGEYKNGLFTPSPGGSFVGAATHQDIYNHAGGIEPQVAMVMDKNGRFNQVAVMGMPITAHSFAPDGSEIPITAGTNPVVGYMFNFGGKQTIQYKDGKGNTLYSDLSSAPWGGTVGLSDNGKGYDLNIPMPTTGLANTGFSTSLNKSGQTILQYDPMQAMLSTDPEHKNAILNSGGDPNTDFRSYAVAVYHNDPQGSAAMSLLRANKDFGDLVTTETYIATGFKPQRDDKGNQIGWTGGDQNTFNLAQGQNTTVISGAHPGSGALDRGTPASALTPDNRFENDLAGGFAAANSFKPLASSQLPATQFGPMTSHLDSGTLNASPNAPASTGIGDIQFRGVIKTPSVGPIFGPSTPQNFNLQQPAAPTTPNFNLQQPTANFNLQKPPAQSTPIYSPQLKQL